MNEITIIIITYKSEKIIYDFIKKIPSTIKTIIIENSQNYELKKNIEQNYNNISVYIKENNGVSSALNFAVEKIKTKYFLQISPDLEFNFDDLNIFLDFANEKKNKFAAIGPRFLEVKEKGHKQISESLLDDFFSLIIKSLKDEGKIKLSNFGTFSVRSKNARVGRNPKTKEKKNISKRNIVLFKPAKEFKRLVNLLKDE